MILVVDASVVIKWFVAEARSDAARAVLGSGETLIAPDLVVAEACNAAWKKVRLGEMSAEQGAAAVHAVPLSLDRLVSAVGLAVPAFALAHRWNHPVYDCFYLALAAEEQAPLVTDDARVLALAKKAALSRWVQPLAGFVKRRS